MNDVQTAQARGAEPPILEVRDLEMRFPGPKQGFFRRSHSEIHAVNGVSFSIRPGEVLGLVGESGCGKSTLGRCIVGSHRASAGQVLYRDAQGGVTDVVSARGATLRRLQRDVRVIFQDPFSSLNPRMTVMQIVGDPLVATGTASGSELEDRVGDMLVKVGLSREHMRRYPHAFSGGERQRLNIARALIMNPRLVIADEAVSALDVSVRAQILNLLRELQEDFNLTYLFISHDLSVVESLCDRVAVMYLGRIAELADTEDLYAAPQHPYTEALLSAVPRPDPRLRGTGRRVALPDDFPDPANPPSGCFFHTRCSYATEQCTIERPALVPGKDGALVSCHRASELNLMGVAIDGDADGRPVPLQAG